MDIILTIPKTTDTKILIKELESTNSGKVNKNIKISSFPRECKIGEKCHLIFKSKYIGYMHIVGFEEKSFTCSTTGRKLSGKFVLLSGGLYTGTDYDVLRSLEIRGFQGYRYYKISDYVK